MTKIFYEIVKKFMPNIVKSYLYKWRDKCIMWDRFYHNLEFIFRPSDLWMKKCLSSYERSRIRELDTYKNIIIAWIPFHIIGHFCMDFKWFCNLVKEEKNKDNYYLIVPCYWNSIDKTKCPNSYLYKKFCEKFEDINENNVYFWKEYIKNSTDKVIHFSSEDVDKIMHTYACQFFEGKRVPTVKESCINFSNEEIADGNAQMKEMGITEDYICIFARDTAFKNEENNEANTMRNSDIRNFNLLTETFYKKYKIQSVRMGAKVERDFVAHGGIDYSNLGRSEFMDAFLFSKCLFFIGDASGIYTIAELFNKPIVVINCLTVLAINEPRPTGNLIAYANLYDEKKRRNLTLRERIALEIKVWEENPGCHGMLMFFKYVSEHQMHFVVSLPDEIMQIADEMRWKLVNKTGNNYESEMQKRYREIVYEMTKNKQGVTGLPIVISNVWLQNNRTFLQ